MKTKAHAGPHFYDCMSQPPSPLWAGLPTRRKSPGRAGQGFQCQLFPTGTADRASAPGDVQHKQQSSCRQANGLFSVEHSERTRGTEHQLKCRELRLNTEIDLWEVVRCSNGLPRGAVECPRLQILKIPWDLGLSSPLQLSPLWAGGGTKWFPEVPANLSPCCSSPSLEETVATQGLPKYNREIFVVSPHVHYNASLLWEKLVENGLQPIFFCELKNLGFPTYSRVKWNKGN